MNRNTKERKRDKVEIGNKRENQPINQKVDGKYIRFNQKRILKVERESQNGNQHLRGKNGIEYKGESLVDGIRNTLVSIVNQQIKEIVEGQRIEERVNQIENT